MFRLRNKKINFPVRTNLRPDKSTNCIVYNCITILTITQESCGQNTKLSTLLVHVDSDIFYIKTHNYIQAYIHNVQR